MAKILIIEDNAGELLYLNHLLSKERYKVVPFENGIKALAYLTKNPSKLPDIVITDLKMPEMDGLELTKLIRKRFPDIFVIVITGINTTTLTDSFNAGAIDYISKPFHKEELLARTKNALALKKAKTSLEKTTKKLSQRNKTLKKLSITDTLTGIYNRHYILEQLEQKIYDFERYSIPFCLSIIDLDFFKHINDTFGHQSGDEVLVNLVHLLKEHIRKSDIIGRMGGDEFLFILPNTTLDKALTIMNKLQIKINELKFDFAPEEKTTFSGGICEYAKEYSPKEFIANVDRLLYKAKKNGRNRIEI